MHEQTSEITELILKAKAKAVRETGGLPDGEIEMTLPVQWPVTCTVGPGLEGAIACESSIGYVNGTKGWLIYRGHNIFDLCAYSTFEEVSYLLLNGKLPTHSQLTTFRQQLTSYRHVPYTLRLLMNFLVEKMHPMAALRLGTNLMRQEFSTRDWDTGTPPGAEPIYADEDSIPMETKPRGGKHAIYEFNRKRRSAAKRAAAVVHDANSIESCHHLIAGVATITAAILRIRSGRMPLEPDPALSHAANFLYMITGRTPTPVEERVMDVALILHADHGMNASTFAAMVVASTLSDFYFSTGAGVAALNGPLHGGANQKVLEALLEIGPSSNVPRWLKRKLRRKERVPGFGHRVYKTYDPRARILGPLAARLAKGNPEMRTLMGTARALEREVVASLGTKKGIFPNVDFFSGLVYAALGIPPELFTPTFAVARVSGWTARILEYLRSNRIFRPRAMYVGSLNKPYEPIETRGHNRSSR